MIKSTHNPGLFGILSSTIKHYSLTGKLYSVCKKEPFWMMMMNLFERIELTGYYPISELLKRHTTAFSRIMNATHKSV